MCCAQSNISYPCSICSKLSLCCAQSNISYSCSICSKLSMCCAQSNISYLCSICSKSVKSNQKALLCDNCCEWTHLKCISLTVTDYIALSIDASSWYFVRCLLYMIPFNAIESNFAFNCALFNYAYNNSINANTVKQETLLHILLGEVFVRNMLFI